MYHISKLTKALHPPFDQLYLIKSTHISIKNIDENQKIFHFKNKVTLSKEHYSTS